MLSIFSPTTTDAEACQYYRIDAPLKQLKKFGCNTYNQKRTTAKSNSELVDVVFASDIVWTYSPYDCEAWNEFLSAARGMPPVNKNGATIYPPLFVWDADDNLDFVHPLNQTFIWTGTRGLDGKVLSPGDTIAIRSDDGEDIPIWIDNETQDENGKIFSIEENLRRASTRRSYIKHCAGATCPSENLASYYRDALGQKNVHVYHNTIVPEDYAFNVVPVRTDPDCVRIFWQGGQSHLSDWMLLKDAVGKVARKYPNTKWIFFGVKFDFLLDQIPANQLEFHDWCDYSAYRLRRTLFNVDINLCPLQDTIFNRGKSAIKWYESTVSHNFEATLAQATGPYLEITDGENGLLFKDEDEFYQKMCLLIENAELRNRLGENARKWVNSNRLPQHTTPGLLGFFNELRERQRIELSPKIIPGTASTLKEALSAR